MIGEQTKLTGRASRFALKACFRQAGFLRTDDDDIGDACFNFVSNCAQECGAFSAARIAISPESIFRSFTGAVHQINSSNCERMGRPTCWCRLKCAGSVEPFASNKVFSFGRECHSFILL
ncbi:hypothetical protein D9M68_929020 [compost metagenome]